MSDKIFENNQVSIVGEIVSDFHFSHEEYGEGFYTVDVAVNRLSNFMDYIPLMISERLIDVTADYRGQIIYATGQFHVAHPDRVDMWKDGQEYFFYPDDQKTLTVCTFHGLMKTREYEFFIHTEDSDPWIRYRNGAYLEK